MATASILAGAELGLWWGDRIGRRLSDWLRMTDDTGRFLGAMFCLLLCVALVGVAGSLVVTWLSVSGPASGGGLNPWSLGVLLIDALTVRVAIFTLRRSPSGAPPDTAYSH